MESLPQALGTRIRQFRELQGLTQATLAERAGLAVDAVGRVERGTRTPRLDTLSRLATALGVPLPELVDVDGQFTDRATLAPELIELVELYRTSPPSLRGTALRVLRALVQGEE